MTLNEVMKAIADAIREKTGKSELIKPVDFAEEIRGITAGGGTSEEERIYISHTELIKLGAQFKMLFLMWSESAKYIDEALQITPIGHAMEMDTNHGVEWVAYCMNLSTKVATPQIQGKIGELLAMQGFDVSQLSLMTEAEFYDLNA